LERKKTEEAPHARRRRHILFFEVITLQFAVVALLVYVNFLAIAADFSSHLGLTRAAEALYNQALFVQKYTRGADSQPVIDTLNEIAYFYYDSNQTDKAVQVIDRNLAICQAKFGQDDPQLAWTLSMASLTYDGAGRYSEAERMARRALPILESAYGKQNWSVASTWNRLGLALEGEERFPEAEDAFIRALRIREFNFGTNSPSLLPILQNLARTYEEHGKQEEAAACRRRAEEIAAR